MEKDFDFSQCIVLNGLVFVLQKVEDPPVDLCFCCDLYAYCYGELCLDLHAAHDPYVYKKVGVLSNVVKYGGKNRETYGVYVLHKRVR